MPEPFRVGAEQMDRYLPLLAGRRVAVVTNATGRVGPSHLVDTLLASGVRVVKVFAPEHGFRGDADAGEHVKDQRDARTGLPLISLYGANKKPGASQLSDVDLVVFDIQDVGVRFYTYISTLHYVMEACAEQGRPLLVLDRPNPNGHYVDGPVLEPTFRSFVGMHPVPLVHGMTIGEFAEMINGEGWLKGGVRCNLTVVLCSGYDHAMRYDLPVRPSPNLPNAAAVALYPSLGLFEGTVVSVGRGTDRPFQCIGYPGALIGDHRFTPRSMPGAKDPPHLNVACRGFDLVANGQREAHEGRHIQLQWLLALYQDAADKEGFFLANRFFDKLAGTDALRKAIIAGRSEEEIRSTWAPGLRTFATIRARYLRYADQPR